MNFVHPSETNESLRQLSSNPIRGKRMEFTKRRRGKQDRPRRKVICLLKGDDLTLMRVSFYFRRSSQFPMASTPHNSTYDGRHKTKAPQNIDTSIIEDDRKEIAKAAPDTEVKEINVDVNRLQIIL